MHFQKRAKIDAALEGFEEILAFLVSEYGEKHRRVATALHNLGVVHLRAGNFDDAVDSIEEAIKIRKEMFGESDPRIAVSCFYMILDYLLAAVHCLLSMDYLYYLC